MGEDSRKEILWNVLSTGSTAVICPNKIQLKNVDWKIMAASVAIAKYNTHDWQPDF